MKSCRSNLKIPNQKKQKFLIGLGEKFDDLTEAVEVQGKLFESLFEHASEKTRVHMQEKVTKISKIILQIETMGKANEREILGKPPKGTKKAGKKGKGKKGKEKGTKKAAK